MCRLWTRLWGYMGIKTDKHPCPHGAYSLLGEANKHLRAVITNCMSEGHDVGSRNWKASTARAKSEGLEVSRRLAKREWWYHQVCVPQSGRIIGNECGGQKAELWEAGGEEGRKLKTRQLEKWVWKQGSACWGQQWGPHPTTERSGAPKRKAPWIWHC